jgi:hypothetical protein
MTNSSMWGLAQIWPESKQDVTSPLFLALNCERAGMGLWSGTCPFSGDMYHTLLCSIVIYLPVLSPSPIPRCGLHVLCLPRVHVLEVQGGGTFTMCELVEGSWVTGGVPLKGITVVLLLCLSGSQAGVVLKGSKLDPSLSPSDFLLGNVKFLPTETPTMI